MRLPEQTTAPIHQLVTWYCEYCETRIAPVEGEANRYACGCGRSRMRVRAYERQPEWVSPLIVAMRRTGGNLSLSCDLAGVTRATVYDRLERDNSLRLTLDSIRISESEQREASRQERVTRRVAAG